MSEPGVQPYGYQGQSSSSPTYGYQGQPSYQEYQNAFDAQAKKFHADVEPIRKAAQECRAYAAKIHPLTAEFDKLVRDGLKNCAGQAKELLMQKWSAGYSGIPYGTVSASTLAISKSESYLMGTPILPGLEDQLIVTAAYLENLATNLEAYLMAKYTDSVVQAGLIAGGVALGLLFVAVGGVAGIAAAITGASVSGGVSGLLAFLGDVLVAGSTFAGLDAASQAAEMAIWNPYLKSIGEKPLEFNPEELGVAFGVGMGTALLGSAVGLGLGKVLEGASPFWKTALTRGSNVFMGGVLGGLGDIPFQVLAIQQSPHGQTPEWNWQETFNSVVMGAALGSVGFDGLIRRPPRYSIEIPPAEGEPGARGQTIFVTPREGITFDPKTLTLRNDVTGEELPKGVIGLDQIDKNGHVLRGVEIESGNGGFQLRLEPRFFGRNPEKVVSLEGASIHALSPEKLAVSMPPHRDADQSAPTGSHQQITTYSVSDGKVQPSYQTDIYKGKNQTTIRVYSFGGEENSQLVETHNVEIFNDKIGITVRNYLWGGGDGTSHLVETHLQPSQKSFLNLGTGEIRTTNPGDAAFTEFSKGSWFAVNPADGNATAALNPVSPKITELYVKNGDGGLKWIGNIEKSGGTAELYQNGVKVDPGNAAIKYGRDGGFSVLENGSSRFHVSPSGEVKLDIWQPSAELNTSNGIRKLSFELSGKRLFATENTDGSWRIYGPTADGPEPVGDGWVEGASFAIKLTNGEQFSFYVTGAPLADPSHPVTSSQPHQDSSTNPGPSRTYGRLNGETSGNVIEGAKPPANGTKADSGRDFTEPGGIRKLSFTDQSGRELAALQNEDGSWNVFSKGENGRLIGTGTVNGTNFEVMPADGAHSFSVDLSGTPSTEPSAQAPAGPPPGDPGASPSHPAPNGNLSGTAPAKPTGGPNPPGEVARPAPKVRYGEWGGERSLSFETSGRKFVALENADGSWRVFDPAGDGPGRLGIGRLNGTDFEVTMGNGEQPFSVDVSGTQLVGSPGKPAPDLSVPHPQQTGAPESTPPHEDAKSPDPTGQNSLDPTQGEYHPPASPAQSPTQPSTQTKPVRPEASTAVMEPPTKEPPSTDVTSASTDGSTSSNDAGAPEPVKIQPPAPDASSNLGEALPPPTNRVGMAPVVPAVVRPGGPAATGVPGSQVPIRPVQSAQPPVIGDPPKVPPPQQPPRLDVPGQPAPSPVTTQAPPAGPPRPAGDPRMPIPVPRPKQAAGPAQPAQAGPTAQPPSARRGLRVQPQEVAPSSADSPGAAPANSANHQSRLRTGVPALTAGDSPVNPGQSVKSPNAITAPAPQPRSQRAGAGPAVPTSTGPGDHLSSDAAGSSPAITSGDTDASTAPASARTGLHPATEGGPVSGARNADVPGAVALSAVVPAMSSAGTPVLGSVVAPPTGSPQAAGNPTMPVGVPNAVPRSTPGEVRVPGHRPDLTAKPHKWGVRYVWRMGEFVQQFLMDDEVYFEIQLTDNFPDVTRAPLGPLETSPRIFTLYKWVWADKEKKTVPYLLKNTNNTNFEYLKVSEEWIRKHELELDWFGLLDEIPVSTKHARLVNLNQLRQESKKALVSAEEAYRKAVQDNRSGGFAGYAAIERAVRAMAEAKAAFAKVDGEYQAVLNAKERHILDYSDKGEPWSMTFLGDELVSMRLLNASRLPAHEVTVPTDGTEHSQADLDLAKRLIKAGFTVEVRRPKGSETGTELVVQGERYLVYRPEEGVPASAVIGRLQRLYGKKDDALNVIVDLSGSRLDTTVTGWLLFAGDALQMPKATIVVGSEGRAYFGAARSLPRQPAQIPRFPTPAELAKAKEELTAVQADQKFAKASLLKILAGQPAASDARAVRAQHPYHTTFVYPYQELVYPSVTPGDLPRKTGGQAQDADHAPALLAEVFVGTNDLNIVEDEIRGLLPWIKAYTVAFNVQLLVSLRAEPDGIRIIISRGAVGESSSHLDISGRVAGYEDLLPLLHSHGRLSIAAASSTDRRSTAASGLPYGFVVGPTSPGSDHWVITKYGQKPLLAPYQQKPLAGFALDEGIRKLLTERMKQATDHEAGRTHAGGEGTLNDRVTPESAEGPGDRELSEEPPDPPIAEAANPPEVTPASATGPEAEPPSPVTPPPAPAPVSPAAPAPDPAPAPAPVPPPAPAPTPQPARRPRTGKTRGPAVPPRRAAFFTDVHSPTPSAGTKPQSTVPPAPTPAPTPQDDLDYSPAGLAAKVAVQEAALAAVARADEERSARSAPLRAITNAIAYWARVIKARQRHIDHMRSHLAAFDDEARSLPGVDHRFIGKKAAIENRARSMDVWAELAAHDLEDLKFLERVVEWGRRKGTISPEVLAEVDRVFGDFLPVKDIPEEIVGQLPQALRDELFDVRAFVLDALRVHEFMNRRGIESVVDGGIDPLHTELRDRSMELDGEIGKLQGRLAKQDMALSAARRAAYAAAVRAVEAERVRLEGELAAALDERHRLDRLDRFYLLRHPKWLAGEAASAQAFAEKLEQLLAEAVRRGDGANVPALAEPLTRAYERLRWLAAAPLRSRLIDLTGQIARLKPRPGQQPTNAQDRRLQPLYAERERLKDSITKVDAVQHEVARGRELLERYPGLKEARFGLEEASAVGSTGANARTRRRISLDQRLARVEDALQAILSELTELGYSHPALDRAMAGEIEAIVDVLDERHLIEWLRRQSARAGAADHHHPGPLPLDTRDPIIREIYRDWRRVARRLRKIERLAHKEQELLGHEPVVRALNIIAPEPIHPHQAAKVREKIKKLDRKLPDLKPFQSYDGYIRESKSGKYRGLDAVRRELAEAAPAVPQWNTVSVDVVSRRIDEYAKPDRQRRADLAYERTRRETYVGRLNEMLEATRRLQELQAQAAPADEIQAQSRKVGTARIGLLGWTTTEPDALPVFRRFDGSDAFPRSRRGSDPRDWPGVKKVRLPIDPAWALHRASRHSWNPLGGDLEIKSETLEEAWDIDGYRVKVFKQSTLNIDSGPIGLSMVRFGANPFPNLWSGLSFPHFEKGRNYLFSLPLGYFALGVKFFGGFNTDLQGIPGLVRNFRSKVTGWKVKVTGEESWEFFIPNDDSEPSEPLYTVQYYGKTSPVQIQLGVSATLGWRANPAEPPDQAMPLGTGGFLGIMQFTSEHTIDPGVQKSQGYSVEAILGAFVSGPRAFGGHEWVPSISPLTVPALRWLTDNFKYEPGPSFVPWNSVLSLEAPPYIRWAFDRVTLLVPGIRRWTQERLEAADRRDYMRDAVPWSHDMHAHLLSAALRGEIPSVANGPVLQPQQPRKHTRRRPGQPVPSPTDASQGPTPADDSEVIVVRQTHAAPSPAPLPGWPKEERAPEPEQVERGYWPLREEPEWNTPAAVPAVSAATPVTGYPGVAVENALHAAAGLLGRVRAAFVDGTRLLQEIGPEDLYRTTPGGDLGERGPHTPWHTLADWHELTRRRADLDALIRDLTALRRAYQQVAEQHADLLAAVQADEAAAAVTRWVYGLRAATGDAERLLASVERRIRGLAQVRGIAGAAGHRRTPHVTEAVQPAPQAPRPSAAPAVPANPAFAALAHGVAANPVPKRAPAVAPEQIPAKVAAIIRGEAAEFARMAWDQFAPRRKLLSSMEAEEIERLINKVNRFASGTDPLSTAATRSFAGLKWNLLELLEKLRSLPTSNGTWTRPMTTRSSAPGTPRPAGLRKVALGSMDDNGTPNANGSAAVPPLSGSGKGETQPVAGTAPSPLAPSDDLYSALWVPYAPGSSRFYLWPARLNPASVVNGIRTKAGQVLEQIFGGTTPVGPTPNATVAALRDLHTPNANSSEMNIRKGQAVSRLSDKKLLQSVFTPKNGAYITVAREIVSGRTHIIVRDGNHRVRELLHRAERPASGITWETPLYIRRTGNWDLDGDSVAGTNPDGPGSGMSERRGSSVPRTGASGDSVPTPEAEVQEPEARVKGDGATDASAADVVVADGAPGGQPGVSGADAVVRHDVWALSGFSWRPRWLMRSNHRGGAVLKEEGPDGSTRTVPAVVDHRLAGLRKKFKAWPRASEIAATIQPEGMPGLRKLLSDVNDPRWEDPAVWDWLRDVLAFSDPVNDLSVELLKPENLFPRKSTAHRSGARSVPGVILVAALQARHGGKEIGEFYLIVRLAEFAIEGTPRFSARLVWTPDRELMPLRIPMARHIQDFLIGQGVEQVAVYTDHMVEWVTDEGYLIPLSNTREKVSGLVRDGAFSLDGEKDWELLSGRQFSTWELFNVGWRPDMPAGRTEWDGLWFFTSHSVNVGKSLLPPPPADPDAGTGRGPTPKEEPPGSFRSIAAYGAGYAPADAQSSPAPMAIARGVSAAATGDSPVSEAPWASGDDRLTGLRARAVELLADDRPVRDRVADVTALADGLAGVPLTGDQAIYGGDLVAELRAIVELASVHPDDEMRTMLRRALVAFSDEYLRPPRMHRPPAPYFLRRCREGRTIHLCQTAAF